MLFIKIFPGQKDGDESGKTGTKWMVMALLAIAVY
jgi:hypothetical protein